MNKFFTLAAITLAVACASCTKGYTLTVSFEDEQMNGKTVYLASVHSRDMIDSAIVENLKAVFTGNTDLPTLARVSSGRTTGNCVLEDGTITLTFPAPTPTRRVMPVPAGTPLNDALAQYQKVQEDLMEELRAAGEMTQEQEDAWAAKYTKAGEDLFYANTNNDLGLQGLNDLSYLGSPEAIDAALEKVGPQLAQRERVQSIKKMREAVKSTSEGQLFKDFTIEVEPGVSESFSQYIGQGKYILVDFWASWCGPCRKEIPYIKAVYEKFHGKNFDVLGLAVWDKPEDTHKAIKDLELPWHSIINCQKIPTDIYGVEGIPHIILFGPDGTIIARNLRGEAMMEAVAKALGK